MRFLFSFAFVTVACAAPATGSFAAEMHPNGVVFYVSPATAAAPMKLANGLTIVPLHQSGIIRDDDQASPLNFSAHDCGGTLAVEPDGATSGAGTCMATDKDGDVWWLVWTSDGKTGGTWQAISGTGKYAGLSGSGTTKFVANFPDRSAISYSGTLTLK